MNIRDLISSIQDELKCEGLLSKEEKLVYWFYLPALKSICNAAYSYDSRSPKRYIKAVELLEQLRNALELHENIHPSPAIREVLQSLRQYIEYTLSPDSVYNTTGNDKNNI